MNDNTVLTSELAAQVVIKPGENPNLTNSEYHSERLHLSSSNFKDLLVDPAKFHNEKILGNKTPDSDKPHLILGSFVHSLVLEPHLVANEYAFFEGWRKAGDAYKQFLIDNPGKTIISKPQRDVGEKLARSTLSNKHALKLLEGGVAEMSLASRILDVPVKMRADYLNTDIGYIADVKTTSQPTDVEAFKQTIQDYRYDLSASLYCQIAHDVYGKIFDFYFIVISKADLGCAVYKCSSNTLSAGAADVIKALVVYKKCLASGKWDLTSASNGAIVDDEILEV